MKSIHDFLTIFLHRTPIDGRKQINGLASIVESEMGHSPFDGSLFAFTTRRRDYVKLLYWNKSGFALWMHRLEKEKFRWPLKMEDETISLSAQQLSWLLDGYDITRMKPHSTLSYQAVS
jgi:transposase